MTERNNPDFLPLTLALKKKNVFIIWFINQEEKFVISIQLKKNKEKNQTNNRQNMVSKTGWNAGVNEMDGTECAVPASHFKTQCWVNEGKWISRAHWPASLDKKPAPGH